MRVLHVVPSFYPAFHYGGPIYSVLNLCLNLQAQGCDVRVLTTDANGPVRLSAAEQNDPGLRSLPVKFFRRIGTGMLAPGLIPAILEDSKWADVVHLTAVYNFSTFPTLMAVRRAGKPLVWSPRGTLQRWKGSRRSALKRAWESACRRLLPSRTILHVTSDEEAKESSPRLGNLPAWTSPNGIDIPAHVAAPTADGNLKILFIGRLDVKKGLENLIEACAVLHRSGFTRWTLRIAGDGESSYVARLHAMIQETGVAGQIRFSGNLVGEQKLNAFEQSDLVVIPSHTENFGIVVAEALAHGRPVIASTGTPWKDVDRHGCGLWIDNDSNTLACAIRKLSACDLPAMGSRGREWMAAEFSWRDRARDMMRLYEQVISA